MTDKQLIERFEKAVRDHAWIGSQPVEDRPLIEAEYMQAKAALTEAPAPVPHVVGIDSRTGRAFGDHGTAMQAVEFALDHLDVERDTFLKCWREGDLDEWPEFYSWLSKQPDPSPQTRGNP